MSFLRDSATASPPGLPIIFYLDSNVYMTNRSRENGAMNKSNKYSPEVKERAVRIVQEARKDYRQLLGKKFLSVNIRWLRHRFG